MNQRRPLDSVLANEVLIVMNIERREDTHSHHITPHYSNYALAVQLLLITQASNPNNQLFLWGKNESLVAARLCEFYIGFPKVPTKTDSDGNCCKLLIYNDRPHSSLAETWIVQQAKNWDWLHSIFKSALLSILVKALGHLNKKHIKLRGVIKLNELNWPTHFLYHLLVQQRDQVCPRCVEYS